MYVPSLWECFFTKVAISRLERTNSMQVRSKIPLTRGMLAVFSKACGLTWKGDCSIFVCEMSLTSIIYSANTARVFIVSPSNTVGLQVAHTLPGSRYWTDHWNWGPHGSKIYTHRRARVNRPGVSPIMFHVTFPEPMVIPVTATFQYGTSNCSMLEVSYLGLPMRQS
jgi:hypothetical protein